MYRQAQHKNRPYSTFVVACAATLFVINLIRIFKVPVTFDEVSYLENIDAPYSDFIHLKLVTANTHILNSILRKFFIDILGNNPFALRLDNLLAQVVYMWFGYKLCARLFADKRWMAGAFLCLNLNPFLFDFWGLSRGYGLAIGFMMPAVYFLIRYMDEPKPLPLLGCMICSIAAVYSNFALLNFALAVAVVLCFVPILKNHKAHWRAFVAVSLPLAAASAFVLYRIMREPIKKLRDNEQLFHGGLNGFFKDTLRSVVKESLFINQPDSAVVKAISYFIAATVLASGCYWCYQLVKSRRAPQTASGIVLWILVVIPVASTIEQHKVYGTRFLLDRTVLFLAILYMLQLCYWLYAMRVEMKYTGPVFGVITGLMCLNFLMHINLTQTWLWAYDKNDLVVARRMIKEHEGGKGKVRVGADMLFTPSLEYYAATAYADKLEKPYPIDFPKVDTTMEFFYIAQSDMHFLPPRYKPDTLFAVDDTLFDGGKYVLMRRSP